MGIGLRQVSPKCFVLRPSWPGGAASASERGGGSISTNVFRLSLNHHPVFASDASRLFLYGAACPSWPGGAKDSAVRQVCYCPDSGGQARHLRQKLDHYRLWLPLIVRFGRVKLPPLFTPNDSYREKEDPVRY